MHKNEYVLLLLLLERCTKYLLLLRAIYNIIAIVHKSSHRAQKCNNVMNLLSSSAIHSMNQVTLSIHVRSPNVAQPILVLVVIMPTNWMVFW